MRKVGKVRFQEWVDAEGYTGSDSLLRYYQDALAHVAVLREIRVSRILALEEVLMSVAACADRDRGDEWSLLWPRREEFRMGPCAVCDLAGGSQ